MTQKYMITLMDGSVRTVEAESYRAALDGFAMSDVRNCQEVVEDFPDNSSGS